MIVWGSASSTDDCTKTSAAAMRSYTSEHPTEKCDPVRQPCSVHLILDLSPQKSHARNGEVNVQIILRQACERADQSGVVLRWIEAARGNK